MVPRYKAANKAVSGSRACHPKAGTGFGKNDTHKQKDSATEQILRLVTSAKRIPEKCVAVFGQEYATKQTDSATKQILRLVISAKRIPEKWVAVFGQEYATKQTDSATKQILRLVTSASACGQLWLWRRRGPIGRWQGAKGAVILATASLSQPSPGGQISRVPGGFAANWSSFAPLAIEYAQHVLPSRTTKLGNLIKPAPQP